MPGSGLCCSVADLVDDDLDIRGDLGDLGDLCDLRLVLSGSSIVAAPEDDSN